MTEPTTAAGRAFAGAWESTFTNDPEWVIELVCRIEAEARAAALDEARVAMMGLSLPPGPDFAWVDGHMPFIEAAQAAIDALREDAE